jgi:hypothetical protein
MNQEVLIGIIELPNDAVGDTTKVDGSDLMTK